MRWSLTTITPPAEEPITLAEAKAHLRVEHDADDALIASLITAARQYCEEVQGRAYVTQRLRLHLSGWPRGHTILLPRPPLQSVESVTYVPDGGVATVLDPATYVVVTADTPGRIVLATGAAWPDVDLQPGMPVTIEYTAGYGDAAALPQRVTQAMLLLVGHWYEQRQATAEAAVSRPIAFAVDALLGLDRAWYSGPEA